MDLGTSYPSNNNNLQQSNNNYNNNRKPSLNKSDSIDIVDCKYKIKSNI